MIDKKNTSEQNSSKRVFKFLALIICLFLIIGILISVNFCGISEMLFAKNDRNVAVAKASFEKKQIPVTDLWVAPDTSTIPNDAEGKQIHYGRSLIANTAYYLGPKGSVKQISNGMNCQNCHLEAGTKPFGNNYSAVASNYPKFRERSGIVENIYKRVNDCFERSLNGSGLDSASKEMQAIKAYLVWLGKDVKKGDKPKGVGLTKVDFLNRAADPIKGKPLYNAKCKICHGDNGEGKINSDLATYLYPPLWGKSSYNVGAGLYRLTKFAGYIKSNMPLGTSHDKPQLTDEEAWDIAAFVNSKERPLKDLSKDWPNVSHKSIDEPFGPYVDHFTENQHKYGPFQSITALKNKEKSKKIKI